MTEPFRTTLANLRSDATLGALIRGAATSLGLRVASALLGVALQIYLARALGPQGYGFYIYPLSWLAILLVFGRFGVDTATIRYVAAYLRQRKYAQLKGFLEYSNNLLLLSTVVTVGVVALVIEVALPNLDPALRAVFRMTYLLAPVTLFIDIYEARSRALKRVFMAQAPKAVGRPVGYIVLLTVALITGVTLSPAMAMAINVVASALTLAAARWIFLRLRPRELLAAAPASRSGEWVRTSAALVLSASFSMLLLQTDSVMLGLLIDTTATGLYASAVKIASLMVFPIVAVNYVLSPKIAELHASGDTSHLQRLVTLAARALLVVSVVAFIGIAGLGRPILGLFGLPFLTAYAPLLILASGQLVNSLAGSVGVLMTMTANQNVTAVVLGAAAVLNLVLNLLLIPPFGMHGAAVATASSTIVWNVLLTHQVWRRLGILAFPGAALLVRSKADRSR